MIEPQTNPADWPSVLHLSKNQLQNYLRCPRQFYYQYIIALPWESTPAYVSFGRVIHETAAVYYRSLQQQVKLTLDDVLHTFEQAWNHEASVTELVYDKDGDQHSYAELGKNLLTVFHQEIRPRRIEAVELPFAVDSLDPHNGQPLEAKLVGIVDLIESDDQGNLIVCELKTSSRRYSDGEGENKLDGTIYAYAVNQLGLSPADERVLIRYDVLVKTKTPQFQQAYFNKSQVNFTRFLALCRDILRAIDLQIFYANEGWHCQTCPFQRTCFSQR